LVKYTYSFRLPDKFSADETGANKMSYAIIRTGGKQFSVEAGQTLRVPSIEKNEGEKVEIETLLVGNGDSISLAAATVDATIISHGRGDKIIVFKKKRRKQYKRRQGHRQGYTEITIDKI
jgi:large subunit ribosomal protein L21